MSKQEKLDTAKLRKRIYSFVRPFLGILGLSIFLGILFSIFTTLPFPLFEIVLELLFGESLFENATGIESSTLKSLKSDFMNFFVGIIYVKDNYYATTFNLSLIIVAIFVIKNIIKYLMVWVQTYLQQGIIKSIRDEVFRNLSNLSLSYFSKNRQGNLISILTNDVEVLNNSTIMAAIKVLKDTIEVILKVFFLLAISPFLILISISISLLTFVILRVAKKYLQRYGRRMQERMADFTSTLQETISGIKVVQAYNAGNKASGKFEGDTKRFLDASIKHKKIVSIVPGVGEIFAIISLCIVLVLGGEMVHNGEIASSELILFITMLFGVMSPLNAIVNSISGFQRGYVAADRVFNILDSKSDIISGKIIPDKFQKSINIVNLNFAYEDNPVLRRVDINIEKGKKIAFVGSSGSGKSTILDLVLRFYDPKGGSISLDGTNIKELNLEHYRNLFGLVSQETVLFNDTIKNNLLYSNEQASDNEMYQALKTSNAFGFVSNLPNKIHEVVGDRGQTLSGGERQRLAIARALLRNPEILVFDEATSALDSESEKIVQDAIDKSLKDKTAIIVAHRLATITNCDIIYVFEEGRVVESGSHQELLELGGVYKKLYDIQFGISHSK